MLKRKESDELRQAARHHKNKAYELTRLAETATYEGRDAVSTKIYEARDRENSLAQEKNSKAEELAFKASNLNRVNYYVVDFHNLHVPEAINRLKKVFFSIFIS